MVKKSQSKRTLSINLNVADSLAACENCNAPKKQRINTLPYGTLEEIVSKIVINFHQ